MQKYLLTTLTVLLLASCSSEMREKLEPRPTAFGPLNQLVVIADENLWEGAVGDTFDYYFASAYPVLPQPEPIYDLRHFSPEELMYKKERRELRKYVILADLNDEESMATKLVRQDISNELIEEAREKNTFKTAVREDRWANNQLVVYMFGFGNDKLLESIQNNFPGVNKRIRKAQSKQIEAEVYPAGTNNILVNQLKDSMNIDVRVPSEYFLAMYDEINRTAWVRQETPEVSFNIMFQRIKYTDDDQLKPEYLQARIDSLGAYVSSDVNNTYLVVNDEDLPIITEVFQRDNRYTLQMRGIWEMENDFMGGPFVAEMALNPNTNELLLTFGFIFAPGEDKRDNMKYMEYVMESVQF
ncbi:MAG: DUF4837 family protein [Bacteroidetes bacterium]|nr:DUF4837 family protein [Bacteroidota bacterium]